MKRNLGLLTAYGLESIYDFIGEEKMNKKIQEYMDKPTMGFKLEDFIGNISSIGSITGPLWVMYTLFYSWFNDDCKLALFIYEKSKYYTEENYLEIEPFKTIWKESLKNQNYQKELTKKYSLPDYGLYEDAVNPYWMEYHFFISTIIKPLMKYKRYQSDKEIELKLVEINDAYFPNSERIIQRIKQEKYMWPEKGLRNIVFTKMKTFYKWKSDKPKSNEIAENAKRLGWR